jgi:hypothetical protein
MLFYTVIPNSIQMHETALYEQASIVQKHELKYTMFPQIVNIARTENRTSYNELNCC